MLVLISLVAIMQASTPPQLTAPVDSTPRPIMQMVHTKWSAKDGAPSDVFALGQTDDGYLWIGTRTSLYRFDGVRFVPSTPTGRPMPVTSMHSARAGSAWVIWTKGSLSHLHHGRFETFDERHGLPAVSSVAESPHGEIIAGTAQGLFRFDDGKWTNVSAEHSYPAALTRGLWFDRDGTLWAQTPDRFLYLPPGAKQFVDPGIRLSRTAVKAEFAQTKDGTVWTSEFYRSTHSLPKAGDTRPPSEVKVGGWTLLVDRRGSLWIGSYGDGLRRVLDPTRIAHRQIQEFGKEAEQFTTKQGLQSNQLLTLFEDRDGAIWVGSERGIERFANGAVLPITTPGTTQYRSVFTLRDSTVWVLAAGQMAVHITRQRIDSIADTLGTTNLFQDSSGAVWNASDGWIRRYSRGHFPLVQPEPPRDPPWFLDAIVADGAGSVWVHDQRSGLLRRDRDTLISVANFPGAHADAGSLFLDSRGGIWIQAGGRFGVYEHGHLREIKASADGVRSPVVGFFEDGKQKVWSFGGNGIGRPEGSTLRLLVDHQGVLANRIFGVVADDDGAWWLATPDGFVRVPAADVAHAFTDSAYVPRFRAFGTAEGVPGNVSKEGHVLARAPDGTLWIGTDSGVGHLDPRRLPPERAPAVIIEAVRVDGHEAAPGELTEVPPRSHDMEIDYTVTDFSSPEQIAFRYQLDGADPTWHDVGTRRRAYFTNLAPGSYNFRVAARRGDGDWEQAAAVWSFRVLPAWYQTWWFRAAMVLALGMVFAGIATLIQRRRHLAAQAALESKFEATLAERARIAQDLHDTLLQGFIGVTLQLKAAEGALPSRPEAAAETLAGVQRLARDSLREARERVWDLRESDLQHEHIAAALESLARERTAGTDTTISLVVIGEPHKLPRAIESAAFRIGREAIANAVRHASATHIEIEATFAENAFRLAVRDDGRGFTEEAGDEARRQGHLGLSGARERAAALHGRCVIQPRDGGGTVVLLEIPLVVGAATSADRHAGARA